MTMELFTQNYRVRYSEADRNGHLKLRSLLDYAQDIAALHAARLGAGMAALNAASKSWVLSRLRIRIARYPEVGEALELATWPSGIDRLFACREIRFRDAAGAEFAAATTQWLVIDTQSGRILPPNQEFHALPDESDRLPPAFPELAKLRPVATPEVRRWRIGESRIDVNRHLNNAEYAALLQDALGPGRYPAELQINYQKAIPPETETVLFGGLDENGAFLYTGCADGAPAFTAAGFLLPEPPSH